MKKSAHSLGIVFVIGQFLMATNVGACSYVGDYTGSASGGQHVEIQVNDNGSASFKGSSTHLSATLNGTCDLDSGQINISGSFQDTHHDGSSFINTVVVTGQLTYQNDGTGGGSGSASSTVTGNSYSWTVIKQVGSSGDCTNEVKIISLKSKYAGTPYFLLGVSFPVTFTAKVDWGGHTPGIVRFETPGHTEEVSASENSATYEIDVGAIGLGGSIQATAISGDEKQSEAKKAECILMSSIFSLPPLEAVDEGDHFHYESTTSADFDFLSDALPSGVSIDPKIPVFSDNPFELDYQPELELKITGSHAEYKLSSEGLLPDLELAGFSIEFSPHLDVSADYAGGYNWNWSGGIGLQAGFGAEKSWPFVIPGVPAPLFAKLSFSLSANTTLTLNNLYPVDLSGTLEIDPTLTGTAAVGVDDVVAAGLWVTGSGHFALQYPGAPHLQSYGIHVSGGLTLYAHLWIANPSYNKELFQWDWPSAPALTSLSGMAKQNKPQPYPRDYLGRPSYARFNGGKSKIHPLDFNELNTTLYPLQTQVFPFSEPSLSANGTSCYAVWLYDNPSRTLNNRTMLVFSSFDGSQWSTGMPVADDDTADFRPQLRAFDDGTAVVTWENEKMVLSTDATYDEMGTNLEISATVYSPITGEWEMAHQFTTNNYVDRNPKVSGPSATNFMLVWIANLANDLRGSSTNSNQLWYSKWDGVSWSAPQFFANVPYPLFKYDFIYNGTDGHVVMSLDSSNTVSDVNTHELFEVAYQNGTWGNLQRLTTNAIPDENPQMAIDANGNFVLAWLNGAEVSSVSDFNFASRQIVGTNGYSSNLGDFRLANASDGRLAIVWAEPGNNSSDLWRMFYDPNYGVWGKPMQLTDDSQTEMGISAAFYGNDQLMAVYDRVDIGIGDTNQALTVITNADLYALQYQLNDDLALVTNSFIVSPANPAPGDAITLQVMAQNRGDSAVSNVLVAFFIYDPSLGTIEIGETNITDILVPGATAVVSISGTIPTNIDNVVLSAVINWDGEFFDSDYSNDELDIPIAKPDLAVQFVTTSQGGNNMVSVRARIVNQGTTPSQPDTVSFFLNSPTGTNLFTADIDSLAAGETIDLEILMDSVGLGTNFNIFIVIDGDDLTDFDLFNNILPITITAQQPVGPGTIYVANSGDNTIAKFATNSVFTFATDPGDGSVLNSPAGVALDSAGNLYVANNGNNTIKKFTTDGDVSDFATDPGDNSVLASPQGIAFDDMGNLYVANSDNDAIERFTTNGVGSIFVESSLREPQGLAFDSSGNLFVADENQNRIAKITTNGVISTFAADPGDNSVLSGPIGLAFDSAGNLYAANRGNNTIERFTSNGIASVFANAGLSQPRELVFDAAGNLFVANAGNRTIRKFTPNGIGSNFITDPGDGSLLSGEFNLAFDVTGNLYAVLHDTSTIMKFTTNGSASVFANTGLNGPYGLAFDNAGILYVANSTGNTIEMFTTNGSNSTFVADPGDGSILNGPKGLAFDRSGNLHAANFNTGSIERFTTNGAASFFAASLKSPQGLAFDSTGNLYVANNGNNTIQKFTAGGAGSLFASGLHNPKGLAIDGSDNVYIANSDDNTIAKFTAAGASSIFASDPGDGSVLDYPQGLAFDDAGRLYVVNGGDNTIEKFSSIGTGTPFASIGLNSPTFIAIQLNSLIAPVLTIALNSTNVLITWPTAASDFNLETTTNLNNPNWIPVLNTPAIINNSLVLTNTASGSQRFFRLKKN